VDFDEDEEMMNAKTILIALAIVLVLGVSPVAAMWENGNWIPDNSYAGYTVVYNAASDVTSKYRDIDPVKELANSPDMSVGVLQGNIRCGYNTLTPKVGIRNDLAGANGPFTYFPILSDGRFGDLNGNADIQLIPGSYTLYLPDGNGGQPEYSHATIVAGKFSRPEKDLLGHAVSSLPAEVKSAPSPDCHEHRVRIFGHFQYFESHPHLRWIDGYWYTWTCCKKHCHDYN